MNAFNLIINIITTTIGDKSSPQVDSEEDSRAVPNMAEWGNDGEEEFLVDVMLRMEEKVMSLVKEEKVMEVSPSNACVSGAQVGRTEEICSALQLERNEKSKSDSLLDEKMMRNAKSDVLRER